jgi:hypothetical protein
MSASENELSLIIENFELADGPNEKERGLSQVIMLNYHDTTQS